jgi:lipooligosaccharide transport system permease protein
MTHPTVRALEYWLTRYRRTWRGSAVSGLLAPVLFLAAMGLGLGGLVRARSGTVGGLSYIDFLAPGLLAATAMQTAVAESTWPVMAAIKWVRTYSAMLSTSLGVSDVLFGHLGFIALRLALGAAGFLLAAALFGVWSSPLVLLAVPAAVLTGLSFAAPVMAFAATIDSDTGFALLYRLGVIPLFLFSGTFFPVRQLPGWLQVVAVASPLYHGGTLCRMLATGTLGWAELAHAGYLAVWLAVGMVLALLAYRRRLVR